MPQPIDFTIRELMHVRDCLTRHLDMLDSRLYGINLGELTESEVFERERIEMERFQVFETRNKITLYLEGETA